MKTFLSLFCLILFALVEAQDSGNSASLSKEKPAKYPFTSGVISYKITGDATGSSSFHFDRNGWRSAFYKEISFTRYGVESTETTKDLIDGDYKFRINMDSEKGTKELDKNWSSLISYKKSPEIVAAIMETQGAKLQGTDTLINLPCRIWKFDNGTTSAIWEHSGIPLRIEKSLPGFSYTLEATQLEENESFEPDIFSLPENIQWD